MSSMLINSALVGLGGFVGSIARYLVSYALQAPGSNWPAGTLAVNCLGCLAIGAVAQLTLPVPHLSPEARLLLATGFCGGFTTMSAFVFEVAELWSVGAHLRAGGYLFITIAGSLLAFALGGALVRALVR